MTEAFWWALLFLVGAAIAYELIAMSDEYLNDWNDE